MGIELRFVSGSQSIELFNTTFHSIPNSTLESVRGKTAGAFRGAGTFQWTSAVKALSALIIRAYLNRRDPLTLPYIQGGKNSLASTFDYALSKGPAWLVEMFGADQCGNAMAKRIFRRTNPNMKRPGPVVVAISPNFLEENSIKISLDGKELTDPDKLRSLLANIEAQAITNCNYGQSIGGIRKLAVNC